MRSIVPRGSSPASAPGSPRPGSRRSTARSCSTTCSSSRSRQQRPSSAFSCCGRSRRRGAQAAAKGLWVLWVGAELASALVRRRDPASRGLQKLRAEASSAPYPGGLLWLLAGLLTGILSLLRENALLESRRCCCRSPGDDRWWRAAAVRSAAFVLGISLPLSRRSRCGMVCGWLDTCRRRSRVGSTSTSATTRSRRHVPPDRSRQAGARAGAPRTVRLAEQRWGGSSRPARSRNYWLGRALPGRGGRPGIPRGSRALKLKLYLSWYEWPDAVDYY